MDRTTIAIDPTAMKLRRVGRIARRRMRIEGAAIGTGLHTDGILSVEIRGLGSPAAGAPDSFEWTADRPIALVIVRSGVNGEDVAFQVGPSRHWIARGAAGGDGSGIRSVAFCYDAAPSAAPAARPVTAASPLRRGIAAARSIAPTNRERRSILATLLQGSSLRRATQS